jgi:hypothetical protein
MKFTETRTVVKAMARFKVATGLMLRSGLTGEFSDSTIERTPDGQLHVNGYVWAGLLRRALSRVAGAESMAQRIGKFGESEKMVSTLWCESTVAQHPHTSVRTGNRISRRWGAVKPQALFSDEVVAAGHDLTLAFNWFCGKQGVEEKEESPEAVKRKLQQALWVIHQGIETIGGGWSYGYGRLKLTGFSHVFLDMARPEERRQLWRFDEAPDPVSQAVIDEWKPEIRADKSWTRIRLGLQILPGQLLAISTKVPPLDISDTTVHAEKLPDTFVFRGPPRAPADGDLSQPVVITGKAVRQALLAVPLERALGKARQDIWFGSTNCRGRVSVADAEVQNPQTIVLHRIQLCEHTMQNNNLFAGEYLCRGAFTTDVLVETGHENGKELADRIMELLEEMHPDGNAPPGWHRLGHTATCTGQIETTATPVKETFGGQS